VSREAELNHVADWEQANNLKLNRAKSVEIVFTDCRRRPQFTAFLSMLQDIRRVTSIKVLGVTLTNHLSVGDHVRDVICRCRQSLYAIKVLRCRGMKEEELRLIYKSVVLAKMMYASPAWWGMLQPQIRNALKHLFDEECGLVFIAPTIQRRRNWPSTATTNSSAAYWALCGLRGCKNGPAPFPGRMAYKATKSGLVCLPYLSMLYYCIVVY